MNDLFQQQRLHRAIAKASGTLFAARNAQGFWEGELSSSALSTATAVTALAVSQRGSQISNFQSHIDAGLNWLAQHQNADGGWGDTTKSLSNISTTTLCWAAFGAAGADEQFPEIIRNAVRWLNRHCVPATPHRPERDESGATPTPEALDSDELARAIIARYGKDRTFSVPILTMCALAGRLGPGREAWKHVIPLPFELAACPHQLFAALRLPVVSYALPALIAIGQARHAHAPSRHPFARLVRNATRNKTLRVLTNIQPSNGGFLEATPLTSFVTMSLAASGQQNHIVTQRGRDFLLKSQRPDGSWPIDTNLATWCTTLAIDALPLLEEGAARVPDQERVAADGLDGRSRNSSHRLLDWLLKQQFTGEHPYTHAAPGGWAWTDLPGGVPDADDTAGALLALAKLRNAQHGVPDAEVMRAAEAGLGWLLNLQNRDGGIPTFCRGWGALPFDRSSADITAHAIRAWLAWRGDVIESMERRIHSAIRRAMKFLQRTQVQPGVWAPLWFGNEHSESETNLVYGTSRVARALAEAIQAGYGGAEARFTKHHTAEWLAAAQNADGGWGGAPGTPSTVEETALAVEGLTSALRGSVASAEKFENALGRGVRWLVEAVESGESGRTSPIGFYFARLWYFERLYPLIFTVGALRAVAELRRENEERQSQKDPHDIRQ